MSGNQTCTCSNCGYIFIPSFSFDFYPKPTEEDPSAGLCETCLMQGAFLGPPVPIPDGYEEAVCRQGEGEATCSFLARDANGPKCLKGSSMEPNIIGRRLQGSMNAKGDNCSGPPHFTVTNEKQS
ncbi:hypothetical protein A2108_01245 [Candidatus Wolfebacteria bacterium GWA1_42_9]|uniref:Uncharacterized protein n=1 Tax=Candidatus Wolfebacteria bacterium GWA1_42_9 TaxID=1802553 RepID=A0A1F8DM79_9BACT|nr:MAG: hypothetical protein A2108_01245 [Candidatus Wolfebacteria bacterium GWA1_42_9]